MALSLTPFSVLGANRIVDENNPDRTNPYVLKIAVYIEEAERGTEALIDLQEKLQEKQITQEQFDQSRAEFTEKISAIADKNPGNAAVLTSVARGYLVAGENEKAIAHASQAIGLAPDDPFPLTTRSRAYFEAKDFPQAAADAKRALDLDPKDPVAWSLYQLSKGRNAGGSGMDLASAPARHFKEPVRLPAAPYGAQKDIRPDDDPEIARYKTPEGRRYARQVIAAEKAVARKDYLTGFGLANQALSTYADNPRVLAARAVAAWNLGDYRTAAADASSVLKSNPNAEFMLIARAASFNELGRFQEALKDAQLAVSLKPENGRPYLERALAKEGLHDSPDAVLADFERAAELDPRFQRDYDQALERFKDGKGGGIKSHAGGFPRTENGLQGMTGRTVGVKTVLGFGGAIILAAAILRFNRKGQE